jgi:hypothetical protein
MEAVIVQVIVAGGVLAALVVMWGLRSSIRPSIIERLERSMVSNQTRLDAQEGEIEDLRWQIHELREGRIADHALLQEWITYARRLASMFKEATGQEPPPEPTTRARGIGPGDLARLARTIETHFSIGEIDSLAFELGVTSAMSGDTAEARARALVDIARKRGLIARLIQLYREQRPNGGLDD